MIPEFDISEFIDFEDWETQEFIESYWYGMLDGEEKEEAERYIRTKVKHGMMKRC